MKKSKKILVGVFSLLGILLLATSATYAWFTRTQQGQRNNSISSGSITFRYDEKSQGISVNDMMPMTDEQGMAQNNYFEFDITSKTLSNISIPYSITVDKTSSSDANLDGYIKIYLTKVVNNIETSVELITGNEISRYSELNHFTHSSINIPATEKTLYTDSVPVGSNSFKETYRLRIWIADDINMNPSGTGISPYNGSTYTLKVNVYSEGSLEHQIGEVITLGTEKFYYIGKNEQGKTKLLAMYNLNVGDNKNPNVKEGIQDESVKGFMTNSNPRYGTVTFSNEAYWENDGGSPKRYVYNSNSNLYKYVENYVRYLKGKGYTTSGRLISLDELEELGCGVTNNTACINDSSHFLRTTSYWTGNVSYYAMDLIQSNIGAYSSVYSTSGMYGVRPVIIMEEDSDTDSVCNLLNETCDLDTVGSEVRIDTEHFYVIGKDNEQTKLLAKWNLNVGDNKNPLVKTGVQDESIKGDTGLATKYGTVPFNSSVDWSAEDIAYSSRVSISNYVNDYVELLNSYDLNVTGRLIQYHELAGFDCVAGLHTCSGPQFIYDTTYWSGNSDSSNQIWTVSSSGAFNSASYDSDLYGVRPVITLPAS